MFPKKGKKFRKKYNVFFKKSSPGGFDCFPGTWASFLEIEKEYVVFFILYLFRTGSGSDSAKCMHLDPEFGSYNIKPSIIEKTCLHYVLNIHCSAAFCAHVDGIYR
jgi:hypothetical protein